MSTFVFELDKRNFDRLQKRLGTEQPLCFDCKKPLKFGQEIVSVPERSSEKKRAYYHKECWKRKFL